MMTREHYYDEKKRLEALIEYNNSIRCHHVAAKWERELRRLKAEWNRQCERILRDGRTTDA